MINLPHCGYAFMPSFDVGEFPWIPSNIFTNKFFPEVNTGASFSNGRTIISWVLKLGSLADKADKRNLEDMKGQAYDLHTYKIEFSSLILTWTSYSINYTTKARVVVSSKINGVFPYKMIRAMRNHKAYRVKRLISIRKVVKDNTLPISGALISYPLPFTCALWQQLRHDGLPYSGML